MGDVIFRHTCCYFSPHQFQNLQGSAPPWIRELHHRMGMPQPEKGHIFGNKLPLNALPNLQHLLDSSFLQVHHRRLPPVKPIYFTRCHNLNLFSVCPRNELFVGNSFSDITVTFEMSLWSFLFSLSNIFSRTRETGTKSK